MSAQKSLQTPEDWFRRRPKRRKHSVTIRLASSEDRQSRLVELLEGRAIKIIVVCCQYKCPDGPAQILQTYRNTMLLPERRANSFGSLRRALGQSQLLYCFVCPPDKFGWCGICPRRRL